MQFDYEYYTLENGLRVFLMPSNTVNSANVTALIKTGSVHETDETQGITHFVEHVALTATKSWKTKEKLNEISEFAGASFNGATARETLKYYINVPYTQIPFGIKFIYEALYECTLNPEYIEQERKIILDEISKSEDSLGYELRTFISHTLNKNNSGYNREILGTADHVKKYSVKQIKDYYKKVHSPNKVLLSIVGNFDIKETKKIIKKLFEKEKKIELEEEYPKDDIKTNILAGKKSPKTNLVITNLVFPSPSARDMDENEYRYQEIFMSILSGPMSSRLMKRLREKENLLYGISADSYSYETFGYSAVGYDIPQKFFDKTLKIVIEELEKFYNDGPTEKELAHYKEYISNRKIINNDDVFSYANLIRTPLFWNNPVIDLDKRIKIIKEATLTDINLMIKKCINLNQINGFTFGNTNDEIEGMMKKTLKKYIKEN